MEGFLVMGSAFSLVNFVLCYLHCKHGYYRQAIVSALACLISFMTALNVFGRIFK
jgi:hypothetical protein